MYLKNKNLIILFYFILSFGLRTESISAYWTPILHKVCSSNVSKNVTQALFMCDKLMDNELSIIFDDCVRSVNNFKTEKLTKPKLCYYLKMGVQLDRCKMTRYQSEGITLPELVDREQDHTWCLMKIAQPLGWEKLCSDNPNDVAFLMAKQNAVQNCEQRFIEITSPIRDCYKEKVVPHLTKSVSKSTIFSRTGVIFPNRDRYKPAACLSFQYSRKIWKCLAEKDNQQTMQRRANMYISCLRAIRQSS